MTTPEHTVYFGQCPHNDWDWKTDFASYLLVSDPQQPGVVNVRGNFEAAAEFVSGPDAPSYEICEVGFVQAFAQADPAAFATLMSGKNLSFLGGGITSPDNLVANGEAVVRDYLLGNQWLARYGVTSIPVCWLPDDFGHDPQLPVLLEALGFTGVAFARIPGGWGDVKEPLDPTQWSPAKTLLEPSDSGPPGVDFRWEADDGSGVLAHWLQDSYCQGSQVIVDPVAAINGYLYGNADACATSPGACHGNLAVAPTPCVFVPVGCDFSPPVTDLEDAMTRWNTQPDTTVKAVAGSFTDYLAAVASYAAENPGVLQTRKFRPVPYWTGYYATRPLLKDLHHRTTRLLVGAEGLGCLLDSLQGDPTASALAARSARAAAVAQGWAALVPSNHHDYVTGTSVNDVYVGEQIPLLVSARAAATGALALATSRIATMVPARSGPGGVAAVVANPLGVDRSAPVLGTASVGACTTVRVPVGTQVGSASYADGSALPVQWVGLDEVVVFGGAPAFGYSTLTLTSEESGADTGLSVQTDGPDTIVIENAFLMVRLDASSRWGATSLWDMTTGTDLFHEIGPGNQLAVYYDVGRVYQFGNEMAPDGLAPADGTWTAGAASIVETGPWRARVVAPVTWTPDNGDPVTFTYEYTLYANEPVLRVAVTGVAPPGSSVLVALPLPGQVAGIEHGTGVHWDGELPTPYWNGQTFQPTHDFVVASTTSGPALAVYHRALHAWGTTYDGDGVPPVPGSVLYGCLFRNVSTPYDSDNTVCDGVQTVSYAIRVPSGLGAAASGQPLREALACHTPLVGEAVPSSPGFGDVRGGPLPASAGLLTVTPDSVVVTAAKPAEAAPGDLVLRLYQPTNAPLAIDVVLGDGSGPTPVVTGLTAREQPLPSDVEEALGITTRPGGFSFTAQRAVTTLLVASWLGDASYGSPAT